MTGLDGTPCYGFLLFVFTIAVSLTPAAVNSIVFYSVSALVVAALWRANTFIFTLPDNFPSGKERFISKRYFRFAAIFLFSSVIACIFLFGWQQLTDRSDLSGTD